MTRKQIESAHVGWTRADIMYQLYQMAPRKKPPDAYFFASEPGVYIALHYGLLFAVLEYLRAHKSIPPSIAEEVRSIYAPLKLFRNGVFHIQDKAFNDKLKAIMRVRGSPMTVMQVHIAVGDYLAALLAGKEVATS